MPDIYYPSLYQQGNSQVSPQGIIYPNTLAEQQQNIFSQGIQNQLSKLKLQHDIEQTNWLKSVFPNQNAYTPQELMQSAAKTGDINLMQSLPQFQNQDLNRQIMESKARELSAIAGLKEKMASSPYFIGPGMGGASMAEKLEYIKNNPQTEGRPTTLQDADAAIKSSNTAATVNTRLKTESDTLEKMVGDEGMNTLAARNLFLNERPGGMMGILTPNMAKRYPDLLKGVTAPDGSPATYKNIGAVRAGIKSTMDAINFQQKWSSAVDNRLSLLEPLVPELGKLYNALPVNAQSMPFRQLQLMYQKDFKGNKAVGAYLAMHAEAAREYNNAILASASGAGGAGGTGPERGEVYGLATPDTSPETLYGQMAGMIDTSRARQAGIQHTIDKLMSQLDKRTGGKGQQLMSPAPDFSNVEKIIQEQNQGNNPNQMIPGGAYSLFQLLQPSQ